MKKYIIAATIAAGYIILCRLTRGYWNIGGDLIVIIMAVSAWLIFSAALKRDAIVDDREELPVKVAKASGGVSWADRHAE